MPDPCASGARLRSPEHALSIIALALGDDPATGTVLLVDRPPPAKGLAIPVVDDADATTVDRLDELVLTAMDSEPGCRVVLAARRPAGMRMVADADVQLWRRLQARHSAAGVALLDWFILSGRAAFSMAEIAGPPADWTPS